MPRQEGALNLPNAKTNQVAAGFRAAGAINVTVTANLDGASAVKAVFPDHEEVSVNVPNAQVPGVIAAFRAAGATDVQVTPNLLNASAVVADFPNSLSVSGEGNPMLTQSQPLGADRELLERRGGSVREAPLAVIAVLVFAVRTAEG